MTNYIRPVTRDNKLLLNCNLLTFPQNFMLNCFSGVAFGYIVLGPAHPFLPMATPLIIFLL